MPVAALITWAVTATIGFYLLSRWLLHRRSAARQPIHLRTIADRPPSYLPVPILLLHLSLAATGLVLWLAYLVEDMTVLAWSALAVLAPVALLGLTMLVRWFGSLRARRAAAWTRHGPAESYFPITAVIMHGLFGATTIVLVLLGAMAALKE